jgi:Arc/MetJ-type ribon-helix-helix transcriptional regulator
MSEKDTKKQNGTETKEKKQQHKAFEDLGDQVEKFAVKTAESIRKVIDRALSSRNTVLTIRVNDESNRKLNMLVEAGLFKSRSESAAFLIEEGLKSQEALFSKISDKMEKMEKIRDELKSIVSEEVEKKSKASGEPESKKGTSSSKKKTR